MREWLTYWPLLEHNEAGEPQWGPPEEVKCRWDDKMQMIVKEDGTSVYSRAELITAKRLAEGGIVMRSRLAAVPYQSAPKDNVGAYELICTSETPKLNYREVLYEAKV
jgi:hypothetical protein